MESGAKYRNRASVAIEGRIGDKLVIKRHTQVVRDTKVVVGFHFALRAVVQSSVAGENPGAAGGQEFAMHP